MPRNAPGVIAWARPTETVPRTATRIQHSHAWLEMWQQICSVDRRVPPVGHLGPPPIVQADIVDFPFECLCFRETLAGRMSHGHGAGFPERRSRACNAAERCSGPTSAGAAACLGDRPGTGFVRMCPPGSAARQPGIRCGVQPASWRHGWGVCPDALAINRTNRSRDPSTETSMPSRTTLAYGTACTVRQMKGRLRARPGIHLSGPRRSR